MYQQGIGYGNIYCHGQPKNADKTDFAGFVFVNGTRN